MCIGRKREQNNAINRSCLSTEVTICPLPITALRSSATTAVMTVWGARFECSELPYRQRGVRSASHLCGKVIPALKTCRNMIPLSSCGGRCLRGVLFNGVECRPGIWTLSIYPGAQRSPSDSCFARLIHALADRRSRDQARGCNSNVHVGPEAARMPKISARGGVSALLGSLWRRFERYRSTRPTHCGRPLVSRSRSSSMFDVSAIRTSRS
jgi:hypothetical protein